MLRTLRPLHLAHLVIAALVPITLAACDADETAATEVTVTVTSHAELVTLLRRVRASIYDSDARDGGLPVQTQDFVLSADLDAGTQAKLPFSFGISQRRASRFLLVVEGFGSLDPAEAPLIEQKQISAFTADATMAMTVLLSADCFQMYYPCAGLSQTCWPEARACGPLREAPTTPASDLRGLDASALPSRNPPECPPDACDPKYPCTPTPPEGYICLGARADFPMPYVGSKTPPSYDLSEPRIAVDRVTGLAWQRELPERYEGCTGAMYLVGDRCTLDEAKRYCQRLQLGGRAWRLPSQPELTSLLDLHVSEFPLWDHDVFESAQDSYWTSSTVPFYFDWGGYQTTYYPLRQATTGISHADDFMAVRCVSGLPQGRGTPDQRFVVDESAGTVADRATALTWQRAPTLIAGSLDEARAHCAALGPAFRLPHPKELLGIVDANRAYPSLPAAFLETAVSWGWSEYTGADGKIRSATLNLAVAGALSNLGRPDRASALVRCVR